MGSGSGCREVTAGLLRSHRRDGAVDEDGGGGEAVAVQDATTSRSAVDEQRQLLPELLGVGGAGFAGGLGEPRSDSGLVLARVLRGGVLGIVENWLRTQRYPHPARAEHLHAHLTAATRGTTGPEAEARAHVTAAFVAGLSALRGFSCIGGLQDTT